MFVELEAKKRVDGLGADPGREAVAATLAAVKDQPDLYLAVAYWVGQRHPRLALPVLVPNADDATLAVLLADPQFSFDCQTPWPSKMVWTGQPIELRTCVDGTKLIMRGPADAALVDRVVRAIGGALVELDLDDRAVAEWSPSTWERLDRRNLLRVSLPCNRAVVRTILEGASTVEELRMPHDALDATLVPRSLQVVELYGTEDEMLSAELVAALASCPHLDDLWIHPRVDDAAITVLARLPLVRFIVWSGACGDEGARALSNCDTLEELLLRAGTIGDVGAAALARLPEVTELWLDGNRIGAGGVAALAEMASLTTLLLERNAIDDAAARPLARMRGLRRLSLMGNPIADPEALRPLLADVARDVFIVDGDDDDPYSIGAL